MKSIFAALALVTATTLFVNCSTIAVLREPPKVKFKDVRLKDTDFKTALLDVILEVENKSEATATVDRLKYDLSVNSKPLTQGIYEQKVELPAKQVTVVAIPISVKVEDLFSSAIALLSSGGAPYAIKGSVLVGMFDIPFTAEGKIDLKKH